MQREHNPSVRKKSLTNGFLAIEHDCIGPTQMNFSNSLRERTENYNFV